ncbi:MAG: hypothetical protein R3195_20065, partial [Gemmatimonadota bacterium]|nr:hypothetical protein [Gemmatimonadota bacterium]
GLRLALACSAGWLLPWAPWLLYLASWVPEWTLPVALGLGTVRETPPRREAPAAGPLYLGRP